MSGNFVNLVKIFPEMELAWDYLVSKLDLTIPLIGVYDAPDPSLFEPTVTIPHRTRACIFEYYRDWLNGISLQLSVDSFGCGGCGSWWWGVQTRTKEDYIDFLVNKEGLKADGVMMGEWIDEVRRYQPVHAHLFVGPVTPDRYEFLKTVSFFVNPDQLSLLVTAAQYRHRVGDPPPVQAEFGSGCMQMLPLLIDGDRPLAQIGTLDMAMRDNIPPDRLAFTVNRAMFELLCDVGEESFLEKPFLKNLRRSRGGSLNS